MAGGISQNEKYNEFQEKTAESGGRFFVLAAAQKHPGVKKEGTQPFLVRDISDICVFGADRHFYAAARGLCGIHGV